MNEKLTKEWMNELVMNQLITLLIYLLIYPSMNPWKKSWIMGKGMNVNDWVN